MHTTGNAETIIISSLPNNEGIYHCLDALRGGLCHIKGDASSQNSSKDLFVFVHLYATYFYNRVARICLFLFIHMQHILTKE